MLLAVRIRQLIPWCNVGGTKRGSRLASGPGDDDLQKEDIADAKATTELANLDTFTNILPAEPRSLGLGRGRALDIENR